MRIALGILASCVVAAQSASAGAWLREPGTAFFSFSTTQRYLEGLQQSEISLYAEYGAGRRLTLGVDLNDIPGVAGQAMVFARFPLGNTEKRTKMALQLGVGAHHREGQWGALIKPSFSLGRGFSSGWGNGWFNLDAAVELRRSDPDPILKLDATLGLSSGRFRPIVQFESTYITGHPLIWSVIPGVLIDGRKNTTWLIALERRTAGQTSLGLKIGLWRQF